METHGTNREEAFTKQAVTVSLGRRLGDRWNVGVALGSTLAGTLQTPISSYSLSPGPLLTFTGSFRTLDEGKIAPFVLLTASRMGRFDLAAEGVPLGEKAVVGSVGYAF
jgi:hypothetical protein